MELLHLPKLEIMAHKNVREWSGNGKPATPVRCPKCFDLKTFRKKILKFIKLDLYRLQTCVLHSNVKIKRLHYSLPINV